MTNWIEDNGVHIREGYGVKFEVVTILGSSTWTIKQSPFLLDVDKLFDTLDEAKSYCDFRYKELNGERDTIEALRAKNARLIEERESLSKSFLDFAGEQGKDYAVLKSENARLREALKPFADLYDVDDGDDDCYPILNSDLRAARAAIGESDDKC